MASGVLASLALMAAPSWAAKGGNSANAALCEKESAALVAQNGSHFKNAGACTSYAAKGGELAKLAVEVFPVAAPCNLDFSGPCLDAISVGFGLKPSSEFSLGWQGTVITTGDVEPDGVVPGDGALEYCPQSGVSAFAEGTLASGVTIKVVAGPFSCTGTTPP